MKTTLSYMLYTVGGCIGAMLGMHYAVFMFLLSAMLFDTIVGTAKSIRLGTFSSSNLTWGMMSKVFIIGLVLLFGAATQRVFIETSIDDTLFGILISMLSISEVISSIQNIIMVRTGEHIKERDAVTATLNWILDTLRNRLEGIKKG